jgi:thiamine-phosphate pyrophosphorylase
MPVANVKPVLPRRGLYAITDGPRADLMAAVESALRGGAAMLQYRDKSTDMMRRHAEACALRELCRGYGAALIVNDDVELAAACAADGVHLGEHDESIAGARARLGEDATIGVSCYASLERARAAAAAGADYLAFGAFFPSPTKPAAARASVDLLRAAKVLGVPLVAIGGITPDNAAPLIAAGADFVAAISGVFGVADPEAAARKYMNAFLAEGRNVDSGPE